MEENKEGNCFSSGLGFLAGGSSPKSNSGTLFLATLQVLPSPQVTAVWPSSLGHQELLVLPFSDFTVITIILASL